MTVAIILNPVYPDLEQIAMEMPIWVIDSAVRLPVTEQLWKAQGSADAFQGVTLFKAETVPHDFH